MRPFPLPLRRVSLVLLVLTLFALSIPHFTAHAAPTATQIGDFVWREGRFFHNGIQQPGEQGLPFAPVNLYQGSTLVATTNANSAGIYALNVITPGTYTIEMPIPSYQTLGLRGSPANAGSDDTLDSDVAVNTRRATITVGATNDTTIDAAVYDSLDSATYCIGKQFTFTDWSTSLSVQKADPSLGTLAGVYIRAIAGTSQNATLTNNDSATQTFSYIGGAINDLTLPNSILVSTQTGRRVNGITLAPNETRVFNDLVDYKTTDVVIDPSDFGFYQGDGGFDDFFAVPASAQGVTTVIGGGNIVAVAQTRSYATVCVTYVFENPLAVELSAFDAQCQNGTDVNVTWETATEVDTLGFNLWRGATATAPDTLVNPDLIPAQSPGGGGASYGWPDTMSKSDGAYFYWLDAVDTNGATTRYGPVEALVPCAPTSVTLASLQSQSTTGPTTLWLTIGLLGVVGGTVFVLRGRSRFY